MNVRQTYQSLVNKYKGGGQFVKKLGVSSMFLQIGIIGVINGWRHLEIEYYKIAAPLLFALSIYLLIKDFLVFRRIDKSLIQIILEGIELEKKNSNCGNFFHEVLQDFNLAWLLIKRSLANVLALWFLSYLISQFFVEINPNFVMNQQTLISFVGILSAFVGTLYYDSFKPLSEKKIQIFAK